MTGGGFDLPGANGQMLSQCPVVVESFPIVLKVLQQPLRTDFHIIGGVPFGKPLQEGKEVSLSA